MSDLPDNSYDWRGAVDAKTGEKVYVPVTPLALGHGRDFQGDDGTGGRLYDATGLNKERYGPGGAVEQKLAKLHELDAAEGVTPDNREVNR